jgi:hypothetical protein
MLHLLQQMGKVCAALDITHITLSLCTKATACQRWVHAQADGPVTVRSASRGQQACAHPVIVALRSSNFAFSAPAGQTPAGGGGALRGGGGGAFLGGGGLRFNGGGGGDFLGAGAVFFGVGLGLAFGEGCRADTPAVDEQHMCR